ncbi:unnamed protein product, partial [Meganyctiphanes norvegica]
DYWTEVKELRRDLLYCQLSSADLPTDLPFDIDLDLDLINSPTTVQTNAPSLPETLKLIATTDATLLTLESPTLDSAPTTSSTNVPLTTSTSNVFPKVQEFSISNSVTATKSFSASVSSTLTKAIDVSSSSSQELLSNIQKIPQIQDHKQSQGKDIRKPNIYERPHDQDSNGGLSTNGMSDFSRKSPLKLLGTFQTPGWEPTSSQSSVPDLIPRNQSQRMVADQTRADDKLIDKKYVNQLERQVHDLRARVNACHTCLSVPQRTMPTCGGGGPAWRDHRRRERMLRRKQRAKKKALKHRVESKPQQDNVNTTTSNIMPNDTPTLPPDVEILEEFVDSRPLNDIWARTDTNMKRDNLRMRQTFRVSSDFRRGFNQKISRMDEALMQFTDTQ